MIYIKYTGKLCIHVFMFHSVYRISCCRHADQIFPKLRAPHERSSKPVLGRASHTPYARLCIADNITNTKYSSWTAKPLKTKELPSFSQSGATRPSTRLHSSEHLNPQTNCCKKRQSRIKYVIMTTIKSLLILNIC
jgi:hypothetical protein